MMKNNISLMMLIACIINHLYATQHETMFVKGQPINGDPSVFTEHGKQYFLESVSFIAQYADPQQPRNRGLDHIYIELKQNGFKELTDPVIKYLKSLINKINEDTECNNATQALITMNDNEDIDIRHRVWKAFRDAGARVIAKQIITYMNNGIEKPEHKLDMTIQQIKKSFKVNKHVPFDTDRRNFFKAGFFAYMWLAALNIKLDKDAFKKTYNQFE